MKNTLEKLLAKVGYFKLDETQRQQLVNRSVTVEEGIIYYDGRYGVAPSAVELRRRKLNPDNYDFDNTFVVES